MSNPPTLFMSPALPILDLFPVAGGGVVVSQTITNIRHPDFPQTPIYDKSSVPRSLYYRIKASAADITANPDEGYTIPTYTPHHYVNVLAHRWHEVQLLSSPAVQYVNKRTNETMAFRRGMFISIFAEAWELEEVELTPFSAWLWYRQCLHPKPLRLRIRTEKGPLEEVEGVYWKLDNIAFNDCFVLTEGSHS
jgi:hypothetical protein